MTLPARCSSSTRTAPPRGTEMSCEDCNCERKLVHVECKCEGGECGWVHHDYAEPDDERAACDCTLSIPVVDV